MQMTRDIGLVEGLIQTIKRRLSCIKLNVIPMQSHLKHQ